MPVSAIIEGGLNLVNGLIGNASANKQLDKQIAHQEDAQRKQNEHDLMMTREYNQSQMNLAKYQNQYNEEMWNKQNEYNSPEATMKRLVEAGINPRAYQQIGQFANAGSPLPASTPEQKMARYTEPGLSSTQLRMQKLAINNAFTEQRIRAVELSSELFEAKQKRKGQLKEQTRHNKEMERLTDIRDAEAERHNREMENIARGQNANVANRLAFEMRKEGFRVKWNPETERHEMIAPDYWDELTRKEKVNKVAKMYQECMKYKTEREYLYSTGKLKISQQEYEDEMKEITYWLNNLSKFAPDVTIGAKIGGK